MKEERRGPKNPHPNRVAPEVEEQILALSLEHPTYGAQCIANEIRLREVNVSPSGVRGVWLRYDVKTRYKWLMRLEVHAHDDTLVLSDAQVRLLEHHASEFRMRHVEANAPGELLNQDTFYWGTLKGVGKVYTSKMPITFADLLYDRLPFYEALGVEVKAAL